MKKGTFRRVEFTMEHAGSYGHYYINANYRGKEIRVTTTDSEAWDWLDDDSEKEKHQAARRHCYRKIVKEWEHLREKELEEKWRMKHAYDDLLTCLCGC